MTDAVSETQQDADIDLKDPELSKAALKIQGKFRLNKSKKSAPHKASPPSSFDALSANGGESTNSQMATEDQQKDEKSAAAAIMRLFSNTTT